jgi:hypothetical protein
MQNEADEKQKSGKVHREAEGHRSDRVAGGPGKAATQREAFMLKDREWSERQKIRRWRSTQRGREAEGHRSDRVAGEPGTAVTSRDAEKGR